MFSRQLMYNYWLMNTCIFSTQYVYILQKTHYRHWDNKCPFQRVKNQHSVLNTNILYVVCCLDNMSSQYVNPDHHHLPWPAGNRSLTFWTQSRTLSFFDMSHITGVTFEEQLSRTLEADFSFRTPAKTWQPRESKRRTASNPKPELHPVIWKRRIYISHGKASNIKSQCL